MNPYCINLKDRPERWRRVQKETVKLNMHPIRFNAIKREKGHEGCKESHMALLHMNNNWNKFMIIEDDMLVIARNPIHILSEALQQLPYDWDMLYLGATMTKPVERYSDNLFVLKGGSATQAIIYNTQNGVVDYILENHNRTWHSAFLRDDVQEKFNCFITYPMIATQKAGYSDLLNKRVSYRGILKSYKKYTHGK